MPEEVRHITVNGKYRIKIERAASTKGVDGFTIESTGDELNTVKMDAEHLYQYAKKLTEIHPDVLSVESIKIVKV